LAALNVKKASIVATRFQFVEVSEDVIPDGPRYLFREISKRSYSSAKLTVEDILKKESQTNP
jgi:hypothetical protein